jgi:hypothetical protein
LASTGDHYDSAPSAIASEIFSQSESPALKYPRHRPLDELLKLLKQAEQDCCLFPDDLQVERPRGEADPAAVTRAP